MSSLIEQAALRLEQLRRAGVAVAWDGAPAQRRDAQAGPPAVRRAALRAAEPPGPDHVSRRVELDLRALARRGMLTPEAGRSHLAAEYRIVKRPLIRNAMGDGVPPVPRGKLIMVTSARAGEGKTFTAVNLAMSIAMEMDHSVLLVDADVARPAVMPLLGLPPGPGLLDLLAGKLDMADALLRTNVEKLAVLPSGMPQAQATELLASAAMRALLDDILSRHPDRLVIFDSPPLLMTTEARELASHMGQVVLVVKADETPRSLVRAALSAIEGAAMPMLLLNAARHRRRGYDPGIGYGYGYGYGDDALPPARAGGGPV